QAGGGAVDGRADLYALGCTLYALLVGRPPFGGGGSFELVKAHLFERPRRPNEVDPTLEVPEELERVVMRLLQKDPAARGPGAAEVAAELAAVVGGKTVAPAHRGGGGAMGVAIALAVLVLAGVGLGVRVLLPDPPRADPFAALEWTRAAVPAPRLGDAVTALEDAAREPGAPAWVGARAAELRDLRDL